MAAIKQERLNRLVNVLAESPSWVSAPVLGRVLGVSDRSIRSYVGELNAGGRVSIESSQEGYRLVPDNSRGSADGEATSSLQAEGASDIARARRNKVCVELLNATGELSVYELADELHVSESTVLNSVMPRVRELFGRFGVQVEGHGFRFSARGSEQDKRRALGHLATHDTHSYFTSAETLSQLFPDFDVEGLMRKAVELTQRSDLVINNYALNNLLVHLLIIIARLREGNELSGRDELPLDAERLLEKTGQRKEVAHLADGLAGLASEEFGCHIPEDDYRQIELLVLMSAERYAYADLDLERLSQLVDKPLLDSVRSISELVADRYGIERFDDEFLLQLSLHMYNVYQRSVFGVRCPNPLAAQIKRDYAPVYDMAVLFCLQFSRMNGIEVNEDEIAFVAFHIGAYLERAKGPADAVSCVVVLEDYHDFSRDVLKRLEQSFGDEIVVSDVMGATRYLATRPPSDLLVTTLDIPASHPHKANIGPIVTRQSLHRVRVELDKIEEDRRTKRARAFLRGVLAPELYVRDATYESAEECIRAMSGLCVAAGMAREGLADDVMARERTSSTAFTDELAVPHPITSHAERSFVCVLHADRPIAWDRQHNVRFVLLMDIVEQDMHLFRSTFDLIVERFSNVESVAALAGTRTFGEFLDVLAG